MLLTDLSSDYVRSHFSDASPESWRQVLALFDELQRDHGAYPDSMSRRSRPGGGGCSTRAPTSARSRREAAAFSRAAARVRSSARSPALRAWA